ncbi:MAG: polysaccharide deacetylase family protein [Actinomycetota bacterium]|nr:polysaccharide deacetylase family protein [Actinomycetota bacterium]
MITFDDGYSSVLGRAAPILARFGFPGTVFVVTDFVGDSRPMSWPGIARWLGTPHEHELTSLGWDELEALAAAGWEVGSHTCSHPRLTQLSQMELEEELGASRACLEERLGRPCRSVAYPEGDHDERVVRAAALAGYELAFTVPSVLRAQDRLRWPRIGIYRRETPISFSAKVSPSVRMLRRTVVWEWTEPAVRLVQATATRASPREPRAPGGQDELAGKDG